MTADCNGQPAFIAYPVRAEMERERNAALLLNDQEVTQLKQGEVIQKNLDMNGERIRQDLQLAPKAAKSVIHRKASNPQLEQKLKDVKKVNDI